MSIKTTFTTIIVITLFQFFIWSCKKSPPTPPPINESKLGIIKGKVLNSIDNSPVQNAIVSSITNEMTDTTNTNGEFQLDSLAFGLDTLIISASHYDTSYLYIEINKEIEETTVYLDKIPHYYIYAGNGGYNQVFVIDSYTATVIDTFYIPAEYHLYILDISPDGDNLYISAESDDYTQIKTFCLNSKTGVILKTLSDVSIKVMPNGNLFTKHPDEGFRILDPMSYEILLSDTLNIWPKNFHPNLPLLYAQNSDLSLFSYDYETKVIIREYDNLKNVINSVLSPDGKILYGTAYQYRFIAYDLEAGDLLKTYYVNHHGNVAITPDGSEVLLTDPGYMAPPDPSSGKVYFFNTNTTSFDNYIELISENGYPLPTEAVVTGSQGRYAFSSAGFSVYFLNLRKYSLQKSVELEAGGIQLNYLSLSPNLNY